MSKFVDTFVMSYIICGIIFLIIAFLSKARSSGDFGGVMAVSFIFAIMVSIVYEIDDKLTKKKEITKA